MKSEIFVLCLFLFGNCFGAVVKKQSWGTLDPANLDTINRQTRKSLLKSITDDLTKTKANLDLMQPEITECQEKVNQTLGPCAACVNDHCQKRYDQCAIDLNLPANLGLSVFSTNINGKSKVTVCSLAADNSKSCSTIMSPNTVFVSSVSNMGDILRVNLQSAIIDLGGNIVTFIGNAQNFVQSINDTEVAAAIDDVFNQLQVSLNGINHGVHSMVDGLNTGLAQMSDGLASGLQMMELGLSQMMNGFNRQYTDFSTQFHNDMGLMGNDMSQLGTSLGTLGHTIGRTMQNIFGHAGFGSFWGRKKRAVTTEKAAVQSKSEAVSNLPSTSKISQQKMVEIGKTTPPQQQMVEIGTTIPPSNELDCLMIVENSTACTYYKKSCSSCSEIVHSTKEDIMQIVCGANIVQKATLVKDHMQALTEIYDQVLSARNLITKVEFDKSSFDEISMSFKKAFITANVRGKPSRFPLASELMMLDMKRTGTDLANQILGKWLPAI